jgi:hypothetical protein
LSVEMRFSLLRPWIGPLKPRRERAEGGMLLNRAPSDRWSALSGCSVPAEPGSYKTGRRVTKRTQQVGVANRRRSCAR